MKWVRGCVEILGGCLVTVAAADAPPLVDFNRDIRPILANHCLECHGPDEAQRRGRLRLDTEAGSREDRGGYRAVEPGRPEASELIRRILAGDPEDRMPPPEVGRPLTGEQKDLLRRWVEAGGDYDEHWAWKRPVRPEPPVLGGAAVVRNAVDRFILGRLRALGLEAAPEADRATLLRRVTLDLTGLPPGPGDVEAFQDDELPGAYERVVDRLLASPHFGERMAVDWLDAARYADTNGYQVDRDREMYAWRDWVIRAFNENQPFDEFTIEQVAGDLLPGATLSQRIATGFHRNHMMNEEGGVLPEEFLAEYCADRVETTGTVWLGQTLTCARCHDHKFDPFTQRDFYSLYAFFHNNAEQGRGDYGASIRRNNPPMIQLPAPELEAERDRLREKLAGMELELSGDGLEAERRSELAGAASALRKEIERVDLAIPTALVMEELPEPRPTFVLVRGAYDRLGERVWPDTPGALPAMDPDWPRNRLGLTRWLVDPRNPLTARVTVNRLWQSFFGVGLVGTPGDFGVRGDPPSHPDLLDWLAVEFVESGWDIKAMVRLLVTSAAYRRDSRSTPDALARDPENRWLARGPRYRLQAEFIRDQALAAAGLLVRRIGGPSVRPYHPPGLYEQVVAGKGPAVYVPDIGEGLFRRSLYTYWKRSVPNPAMLTFDAPFREACVVRRSRTNTPMQALNLMNDPTYVEAAVHLARRLLLDGGDSVDSRIELAFRSVLAREPHLAEMERLRVALGRFRADFAAHPEDASAVLAQSEFADLGAGDPAEAAACAMMAMVLLNLDETVMRE